MPLRTLIRILRGEDPVPSDAPPIEEIDRKVAKLSVDMRQLQDRVRLLELSRRPSHPKEEEEGRHASG